MSRRLGQSGRFQYIDPPNNSEIIIHYLIILFYLFVSKCPNKILFPKRLSAQSKITLWELPELKINLKCIWNCCFVRKLQTLQLRVRVALVFRHQAFKDKVNKICCTSKIFLTILKQIPNIYLSSRTICCRLIEARLKLTNFEKKK